MILDNYYGYYFAINMDFKTEMFEKWKAEKKVGMIYLDGKTEEEAEATDFSESEYLIMTTNVRHYHITKEVLDFAQQIKLKDTKDYKWLLPIKDQTSQYTFDNTFIIFQKKGDRIIAIASSKWRVSERENYMHWDMFNINLSKAELNIHEHSEYANASYKLLLQLLSFIELSDIDEITIKPNSQHGFGSKRDPNTIYNSNRFSVTWVTSRWVTRVYRPGEFMVTRHQRWQPKGPGRAMYELIWVETFEKKGMTIAAGKERNT